MGAEPRNLLAKGNDSRESRLASGAKGGGKPSGSRGQQLRPCVGVVRGRGQLLSHQRAQQTTGSHNQGGFGGDVLGQHGGDQ